MIANAILLKLLALSSPSLPIGAYCYSQGLETAMESGAMHDEASCYDYLRDMLELSIAGNDLAYLQQMLTADDAAFSTLATRYDAGRDTAEIRLESQQMGNSLAKWRASLPEAASIDEHYGYLPEYARLCRLHQIEFSAAASAYAYATLENLTLTAVKTIPLGQMAGQRVLWRLQEDILREVDALVQRPHAPSGNLPGLASLQAQHETQYSRLFRS